MKIVIRQLDVKPNTEATKSISDCDNSGCEGGNCEVWRGCGKSLAEAFLRAFFGA